MLFQTFFTIISLWTNNWLFSTNHMDFTCFIFTVVIKLQLYNVGKLIIFNFFIIIAYSFLIVFFVWMGNFFCPIVFIKLWILPPFLFNIIRKYFTIYFFLVALNILRLVFIYINICKILKNL